MSALSLKTELDVAELLLTEGWFPGEINGVLVFPLPQAAFHQLGNQTHQKNDGDVIKATTITPTTLHRARQLLASAGWRDKELDSLLKPCLYTIDPWANQAIHNNQLDYQGCPPHNRLNHRETPLPTLHQYRRTMALKRIVSLTLVIAFVSIAVVVLG